MSLVASIFETRTWRRGILRLRAFVRAGELGLTGLAAVVGALSGLAVTGLALAAQILHRLIFDLGDGERLSAVSALAPRAALLAPIAGGLVMGAIVLALRLSRRRPAIDPIEANALYGGRLSLFDSLLVAAQNLVSNGCGASVGQEAGYTQISAGIASRLGRLFELRRADLRTLVGCGAAAAIATAFDAPLAGAFYGFELIIGTYSIATLTPVVVAALCGTLVGRLFGDGSYQIEVGDFGTVTNADYLPALLLGVLCAGFGILVMQGVTALEALARRSRLPDSLRPVVGGAAVGGLALLSPAVLSAGHGALHLELGATTGAAALATMILLKAVASAVSIGTGFRGGLFFASLFLGALIGKLYALGAVMVFTGAGLTPVVYALVGMSALAVAVIGGPLTMTFLALELTGDFTITVLVLVGVIASSLTVRKSFGYSFATWRFHLRGETIRGGHDIGWIRNLTVGRMMRRDLRTVAADVSLEQFRRDFPLGSTQRVVALDAAGTYAGIVLVADAFEVGREPAGAKAGIGPLLRHRNDVLHPAMNAREALSAFERCESEALAVVESRDSRRVVGLLTESHALRRYSEELDRRRREASGEI